MIASTLECIKAINKNTTAKKFLNIFWTTVFNMPKPVYQFWNQTECDYASSKSGNMKILNIALVAPKSHLILRQSRAHFSQIIVLIVTRFLISRVPQQQKLEVSKQSNCERLKISRVLYLSKKLYLQLWATCSST